MIEGNSRGRGCLPPDDKGIDVHFLVDGCNDLRPSVIASFLDDIYFIISKGEGFAGGAMFRDKEVFRNGMPCKALRVAVTVRPDRRTRKRIVLRYRSIRADPQD